MKILLIDNGTKHLKKLKELLHDNDVDLVTYQSIYPSTKNYDLVVLSGGSKFSIVRKPSVFKEEINLVKSSQAPVIGICEGCEIIARAYSSHLRFSFPKFRGVKTVTIISEKFFNFPKIFHVYDAHYYAIKTLGPELTGIGLSKRGYEIIKHNTKPIYGIMFHPEMFVMKSLGDEVFRKIAKEITKS